MFLSAPIRHMMVAQTVGHHNDKVRLEAGATCGLWVGLQDSSCQELTRKLERSEDEVEAGVARGIGGLAKFIPGCGSFRSSRGCSP